MLIIPYNMENYKKDITIETDKSQNYNMENKDNSTALFSSLNGSYVLSSQYEIIQWMVKTDPPIYSRISITDPHGSIIEEFELNEQNPTKNTNRPSGGYRYRRNITLKLDNNNNKLVLNGKLYFATDDPRPRYRWREKPLDNIIIASW
jgi:hypothetical protein